MINEIPEIKNYKAQAVIVNYYKIKDYMTGHLGKFINKAFKMMEKKIKFRQYLVLVLVVVVFF